MRCPPPEIFLLCLHPYDRDITLPGIFHPCKMRHPLKHLQSLEKRRCCYVRNTRKMFSKRGDPSSFEKIDAGEPLAWPGSIVLIQLIDLPLLFSIRITVRREC